MNLAKHYRTLGLRRGASAPTVKVAYRKLVRQYHPDINPDEAAIEQFIKINDAYTAISEAIAASEKKTTAPNIQSNATGRTKSDGRLANLMQTLEKMGLGNFSDVESEDPNIASTEEATPNRGYSTPTYVVERPKTAPTPAHSAAETYSTEQTGSEQRGSEHTVEPAYAEMQTGAPGQELPTESLSAQERTLKREAYEQLKDLLKQQKFPRAIALVEGLAHRMPTDSEIIQWQAIVYQRWGRKLIYNGQTRKARIYLKKALRTDPNNASLWREINLDFWQLANLDDQSTPIA